MDLYLCFLSAGVTAGVGISLVITTIFTLVVLCHHWPLDYVRINLRISKVYIFMRGCPSIAYYLTHPTEFNPPSQTSSKPGGEVCITTGMLAHCLLYTWQYTLSHESPPKQNILYETLHMLHHPYVLL